MSKDYPNNKKRGDIASKLGSIAGHFESLSSIFSKMLREHQREDIEQFIINNEDKINKVYDIIRNSPLC